MKELTKLSIALSILAVLLSGYAVWGGGAVKEFTAEDFDRYAETYPQRQEAKQNDVKENEAKNIAPISSEDRVKGNREAEITIYEYSDFECPFCKRFYKTPAEIVKKFDGKVNAVFRHFPLDFHNPLATKEAIASECAGEQGGDEIFFKYHNEIFERTKSNGRELGGLDLYKIASDLKLDQKQFKECLDTDKYAGKVQKDIASGVSAGVTGTPGVIIKNNKTGAVYVGRGAEPIESIEAAINDLLK